MIKYTFILSRLDTIPPPWPLCSSQDGAETTWSLPPPTWSGTRWVHDYCGTDLFMSCIQCSTETRTQTICKLPLKILFHFFLQGWNVERKEGLTLRDCLDAIILPCWLAYRQATLGCPFRYSGSNVELCELCDAFIFLVWRVHDWSCKTIFHYQC